MKLQKLVIGSTYTYGKLVATRPIEDYPEGEERIAGIYKAIDGKFYIDDGLAHDEGIICKPASSGALAKAVWNHYFKGGKRRRKNARRWRVRIPDCCENLPF